MSWLQRNKPPAFTGTAYISEILDRSLIDVTAPELQLYKLTKPVRFEVLTTPALVNPIERVELLLKIGREKERSFDLSLEEGGVYAADIVPLERELEEGVLSVSATFPDGAVRFQTKDRPLRVGSDEIALSQLKLLIPRKKPIAYGQDGSSRRGSVQGLSGLSVTLENGETKVINLNEALDVIVDSSDMLAQASYTVKLHAADRLIVEMSGICRMQTKHGPQDAPVSFRSRTGKHGGSMGADKLINLPSYARKVEAVSGGRVLIAHLPRTKEVAVIDLVEARVRGSIPLGDSKRLLITGARDYIVVLNQETNEVALWDVNTVKRVKHEVIDFGGKPKECQIAHNTNGPMYLGIVGETAIDVHVVRLDLTSFQTTRLKMHEIKINEDAMSVGADYSSILRGPGHNGATRVPAEQGLLYAAVRTDRATYKKNVVIRLLGQTREVASFPRLFATPRFGKSGSLYVTESLFLVPRHNLMAWVFRTSTGVFVRPVQYERELKRAGLPYLYLLSTPVRRVRKGEQYTYAVDVRCDRPIQTYELMSGPSGMTIDSRGYVRWQIPANALDEETIVIRIVAEDGRELFHRFRLSLGSTP